MLRWSIVELASSANHVLRRYQVTVPARPQTVDGVVLKRGGKRMLVEQTEMRAKAKKRVATPKSKADIHARPF